MGALNGSYTTPTSSRLLPSPFTHTLTCPLPSNIFNFPIPTISLTLSSSSSFTLFHAHPTRGKAPENRRRIRPLVSAIATGSLEEVLPPALDSTSDPPAIFDGTTRLYISYRCPYAQRVWITRNCKGLQDKIKLVPINLQNRPAWYKENVNPANKVPSLEHNNEIIVESLDLIKYIDSNFEGPSLSPSDTVKVEFAEEMFSYTNSFNKAVASSFKEEGVNNDTRAAFDYLETALGKFDDGPFLLGQFSLVDIAYAPFIERYKPFLLDVKNYDIVAGRPRLAEWIEQMDNMEGYKRTQGDPKEHVEAFKQRFMAKT